MAGFILYLTIQDRIIEFPLYAVTDKHLDLPLNKLGVDAKLSLETWDSWYILNNDDFDLSAPIIDSSTGKPTMRELPEVKLNNNTVVFLKAKKIDNLTLVILALEMTNDFTTYTKYRLQSSTQIVIGSASSCDICVKNKKVSEKHAVIKIDESGNAFIQDISSKNGTFLNGVRLKKAEQLYLFDSIYLFGWKLIYLNNVLAINHPMGTVCKLQTVAACDAVLPVSEEDSDLFSRAPRLIQPLDTEEITLEAPPSTSTSEDQPWLFVLGPAVTMPMPMLMSMMINMSVNNRGIKSSIGMIVSMVLSATLGVVWSVVRRKYKNKKDIEKEEHRVAQYKKYISQNEDLLKRKTEFNRGVLASQFLSTPELLLCINDKRELIWNRNINHTDFLTVRLGCGKCKALNPVKAPESRFSLTNDELLELPHALKAEYDFLKDVPVRISLTQDKIIAIIGDYHKVHSVTESLILQVAALHSYLDVKIAVLYKDGEDSLYDWVRWLPHSFVSDRKLRLICTQESQSNVIAHITQLLSTRQNASTSGEDNKAASDCYPHYVVICTSSDLLERNNLGMFMSSQDKLGVTFILAYATLEGVPNECSSIIECSEEFNGHYKLTESRDETAETLFDEVPQGMAQWFARKISGLTIKEAASGEVPNSIDYLSLIGIGRLEQWALLKKYKENRAYEGIRAVLGLGSGSKYVYLDLHEKKHGPHGLVAGTTGSGKSETLQTAIISWAMNYSPEEVAFVLIDYKGGGMANAFIGMPHLAGTITNISDAEDEAENEENKDEATDSLDNNQTRRALVSIKAEIKYRQGLFKQYKVNHIDAYMKLYRKGKTAEPMPHLIIISDEFAELKKEQPEFIKELVSAARVGRSLGIHLILATQKPGNSVDDEIWANSRFKLCLRVQDRADSSSMLHRPDAAYLTQTGRGYFQLGNDEIFEVFQTGYSGAIYEPKNKIELPEDSVCVMIEPDGTDSPIDVERKPVPDDAISQLDACIKFIIKATKEAGINATRQLWAPQLTKKLYFADIKHTYSANTIQCLLGLIDDPARQTQYSATFNFLNTNNLIIVGMAGMGKSTLLQTMLFSLINFYTPKQVNFYLIDCSSRLLKAFNNTPHCGGFITPDDDDEKIDRLFQLLETAVEERKTLFDNENVGNFTEYYRKKELPLILIVIDNFASFTERYSDSVEALKSFTRESVKYGIQFILSCNKLSEIASKIRQNCMNAVTLALPEKGDYREAFGVSAEFIPAPYKGRGLFQVGGRLLEFHTALPIKDKSEAARNDMLLPTLKQMSQKYASFAKAKTIPVLPREETLSQFFDKYNFSDRHKLPIGYDIVSIEPYCLDLKSTYCVFLSDNGTLQGLSIGIRNILYSTKALSLETFYIHCDRRIQLSDTCISRENVYTKAIDIINFFTNLMSNLEKRIAYYSMQRKKDQNFRYSQKAFECKEELVIVFDNIFEFLELVDSASFKEVTKEVYEKAGRPVLDISENFRACLGVMSHYGVFFVFGVTTQMYSCAYAREKWYKDAQLTGKVLHFGGRIDSQNLFSSRLPRQLQSQPDEPNSLVLFENNTETRIFTAGVI